MSRILHLGLGNFHRAHQAWFTHAANAATGAAWRITGVSLRRADLRDALRPQGYAYTLVVRGAGATAMHEIGVLEDVLVAAENPGRVVAALADPAVAVVTMTVTEKGYDLDARGALRLDAPGIAADLAGRPPASAIGVLAAGLARRAASGAPLSVLCCDNLPRNGVMLEAAVRAFAAAAGLEIEAYLCESVAFPSSMVDRITPATDDALRAEVAAAGRPATAPVATEAFAEWVIEDAFAAARPDWDRAGARFAADVAPYETRKLRMLNGAHSFLAYAGLLAGYAFVHEAVADPRLARTAAGLMDEAASTLPDAARAEAGAYKAALLARFGNAGIAHRLRQIAMDGSLKLPIRILPVRASRLARDLASPCCDAALAAWLDFLAAEVGAGRPLDDPDADRLRKALQRSAPADPVDRALSILHDLGRSDAS